jgi:hypothetical protein
MLSEEHRYRYDAQGMLRFIDLYDASAAFTKRTAYSYAPNGYLSEVLEVNPKTTLATSRTLYTYDKSGLVSQTTIDGLDTYIDGVIDWTKTYDIQPSIWTVQLKYADPNQPLRVSTYNCDSTALTVSNGGGGIVLAAPLVSPNQILAMPDEVETPKILSGSDNTFTYDATGKLSSVTALIEQTRDDYSYVCP